MLLKRRILRAEMCASLFSLQCVSARRRPHLRVFAYTLREQPLSGELPSVSNITLSGSVPRPSQRKDTGYRSNRATRRHNNAQLDRMRVCSQLSSTLEKLHLVRKWRDTHDKFSTVDFARSSRALRPVGKIDDSSTICMLAERRLHGGRGLVDRLRRGRPLDHGRALRGVHGHRLGHSCERDTITIHKNHNAPSLQYGAGGMSAG